MTSFAPKELFMDDYMQAICSRGKAVSNEHHDAEGVE